MSGLDALDAVGPLKQETVMTTLDSPGTCALCGHNNSQRKMLTHLRRCAPAHDASKGASASLYHLRVYGRENAIFWLDLEIKGAAKLRQLDDILRKVWLECCGHLSAFRIDPWTYTVSVDRTFEVSPSERSMNVKVSEALPEPGRWFGYEYDFGSTTELSLRVVGSRQAKMGRSPVRFLARNDPPVWPCSVCKEPAAVICPFCTQDGDSFCCRKHAGQHRCGEDEAFLPVVNSPRMGVCGYTGEA